MAGKAGTTTVKRTRRDRNRSTRNRLQSLRAQVETLEPRIVLDGTSLLAGLTDSTPAEYKDFLQISEINYNPSDPTAAEESGGVTDNDDFEFIELYNSSDSVSLDLNGVQFTSGVTFDFTGSNVTSLGPGDYVLLAVAGGGFTWGAAIVRL